MSISNIIYGGDVRFPLAIIPTGNQPLDVRTVVQNMPANASEFVDGAVYIGMTVSCVADKKYYMLIAKADNGALTWREIGAAGETAVDLATAKAMATADGIGKIIQITGVVGTDGQIANESEIGTYVVVGPGMVNKLATTTESGDLVADVTTLQGDVAAIKTNYAKTTDLANYATIDGWKVKDVDKDDKVLSLTDGVLSSTISFSRANYTFEGKTEAEDALVLYGKNNEVLGAIPTADFVVDGMLQNVELDEDDNNLVFTFNIEVDPDGADGEKEPTKTIKVDLSKYITIYNGDGEHVKVEGGVISLVNPFTSEDKENLESAIQPDQLETALNPFAKTEDVNETLKSYATKSDLSTAISDFNDNVFNPWVTGTFKDYQDEVASKFEQLDEALAEAGKVDDVIFNGESIVSDNKIANLDSIFATSIRAEVSEGASEEEITLANEANDRLALSVGLAKDSFLKIENALTANEIDALLSE